MTIDDLSVDELTLDDLTWYHRDVFYIHLSSITAVPIAEACCLELITKLDTADFMVPINSLTRFWLLIMSGNISGVGRGLQTMAPEG